MFEHVVVVVLPVRTVTSDRIRHFRAADSDSTEHVRTGLDRESTEHVKISADSDSTELVRTEVGRESTEHVLKWQRNLAALSI